MNIYKDRCFCSFWKLCAVPACGRKLTQAIERNAKIWGLTIERYKVKPDCFEERK